MHCKKKKDVFSFWFHLQEGWILSLGNERKQESSKDLWRSETLERAPTRLTVVPWVFSMQCEILKLFCESPVSTERVRSVHRFSHLGMFCSSKYPSMQPPTSKLCQFRQICSKRWQWIWYVLCQSWTLGPLVETPFGSIKTLNKHQAFHFCGRQCPKLVKRKPAPGGEKSRRLLSKVVGPRNNGRRDTKAADRCEESKRAAAGTQQPAVGVSTVFSAVGRHRRFARFRKA